MLSPRLLQMIFVRSCTVSDNAICRQPHTKPHDRFSTCVDANCQGQYSCRRSNAAFAYARGIDHMTLTQGGTVIVNATRPWVANWLLLSTAVGIAGLCLAGIAYQKVCGSLSSMCMCARTVICVDLSCHLLGRVAQTERGIKHTVLAVHSLLNSMCFQMIYTLTTHRQTCVRARRPTISKSG